MIHVTSFGTTRPSDGRPATEVASVTVTGPVLSLRLLTLGAAIASLEAPDVDGRSGPVHLGLGTLADYEDRRRNPYLGASIGRYANRIAGARFVLDGNEVRLAANEGANQLHGGPDGFDRRVWTLTGTDDTDGGGSVTLALRSPAGDQGFPGTLDATATYQVDGDRLRITYTAETDAPTVVNLTNHGYWNLGGGPTVSDHRLAVAADEVLLVGRDGIPADGVAPVDGTPLDLRAPTRLGPVLAAVPPGLDHCFAIRGPVGALRAAAVLDAPSSGRWMAVLTDQPGLQVYSGNGLGDPFPRHGSVSLETQLFPDTPNRPELGSAVLRPGRQYRNLTELRFGRGEPPALADLGS